MGDIPKYNSVIKDNIENSFTTENKSSSEILKNIKKLQKEINRIKEEHKDKFGMPYKKDIEKKEIYKLEESIKLLKYLNEEYKNNIPNIKVNNITEFYNSQFGKIGLGNLDYTITKNINIKFQDYNINSFIEWNINKGPTYNLLVLDGIVYEFDGKNPNTIKKSNNFKLKGMNIVYGDGKVVEQNQKKEKIKTNNTNKKTTLKENNDLQNNINTFFEELGAKNLSDALKIMKDKGNNRYHRLGLDLSGKNIESIIDILDGKLETGELNSDNYNDIIRGLINNFENNINDYKKIASVREGKFKKQVLNKILENSLILGNEEYAQYIGEEMVENYGIIDLNTKIYKEISYSGNSLEDLKKMSKTISILGEYLSDSLKENIEKIYEDKGLKVELN